MNTLGTFARFCIVGTVGFLVDVGVLYALSSLLGWYGARALSFLCAATVTWALNRRHTFADTTAAGPPRLLRQYLTYLTSMLAGGAVNYLAYLLTLRWTAFSQAPALGVAIGSVAGLAVNYLLAQHLVFKGARHP